MGVGGGWVGDGGSSGRLASEGLGAAVGRGGRQGSTRVWGLGFDDPEWSGGVEGQGEEQEEVVLDECYPPSEGELGEAWVGGCDQGGGGNGSGGAHDRRVAEAGGNDFVASKSLRCQVGFCFQEG